MPKRRKILYPVYSQPAEGTPAAGAAGGGTGPLPGGVAQHSAAAQAAAAGQQQAPATQEKPAGYVPVAEVAQERAKRHELETKLAEAEAAKTQQLEQFKQALGLSEGQTPEQLKAAVDAAKGTATAAQAQLSVFKLAKDAGGDAHALLDSASFLNSIKAINPNDNAAMTAAIKAAVDANKNLALQKVAPAGSHDAGQGAGNGTAAPSMTDLIRSAVGKS